MSTATVIGKDRLHLTLSKQERIALRKELTSSLGLADCGEDGFRRRSVFKMKHLLDLENIYVERRYWGTEASDQNLLSILGEYFETAIPYFEERMPYSVQHLYHETGVIWNFQQYADVVVLGMPPSRQPSGITSGFLLIGNFSPDLSSMKKSVQAELRRVNHPGIRK